MDAVRCWLPAAAWILAAVTLAALLVIVVPAVAAVVAAAVALAALLVIVVPAVAAVVAAAAPTVQMAVAQYLTKALRDRALQQQHPAPFHLHSKARAEPCTEWV
jgi:ABC-type transport system involved in cytochrome bd biosynthesis fused ATPase/permease subunit